MQPPMLAPFPTDRRHVETPSWLAYELSGKIGAALDKSACVASGDLRMKGKATIFTGAVIGGVVGLYGGALLIGVLMGNGQAAMAAFYLLMPLGALLGALVGWSIVRKSGKG
jgi:predicted lipid-binding transport protein (Tim44 family)